MGAFIQQSEKLCFSCLIAAGSNFPQFLYLGLIPAETLLFTDLIDEEHTRQ